MTKFVKDAPEAVLATAKDMLRRGLTEGTAGNISARQEDGTVVITPSSVDYDEMNLDDLVVVGLDGEVVSAKEGRSPSSEKLLHLSCYRAYDDIGSVIHSHPVYATMFAVAHQNIPACIDEFTIYVGGDVRVTEYASSGSPALGDNAVVALEGSGRRPDRQPRPGRRGPPPRQGPAHHRAGRTQRPDRLGCKSSGWSGSDPRGSQHQLRRDLQVSARQPDVAPPLPGRHAVRSAEQPAEVSRIGYADSSGRFLDRISLSVNNFRASAIRRSMIHSCTVRPVRRRTTVVRCPGVIPTSCATSRSDSRSPSRRSMTAKTSASIGSPLRRRSPTTSTASRARSINTASGAPAQPADSHRGARPVRPRSTRWPNSSSVGGFRQFQPEQSAGLAVQEREQQWCVRQVGHGDRPSSPNAAGSKITPTPPSRSMSASGSRTSPAATTYTSPAAGRYHNAGKSWM